MRELDEKGVMDATELLRAWNEGEAFAKVDPRESQVVELRFFGGLSVEETAEVLGISVETVTRDRLAPQLHEGSILASAPRVASPCYLTF